MRNFCYIACCALVGEGRVVRTCESRCVERMKFTWKVRGPIARRARNILIFFWNGLPHCNQGLEI